MVIPLCIGQNDQPLKASKARTKAGRQEGKWKDSKWHSLKETGRAILGGSWHATKILPQVLEKDLAELL